MKILMFAIIIVVILLGVWVLWPTPEPAPSAGLGSPNFAISDEFGGPPSPAGERGGNREPITVAYSAAGFSPTSVSINIGDTVRFVNQSDQPLWVASDPHPTHTNLPGLDERAAILQGGTYNYTFLATGTWGYHNHLGSSHKGTIVVQ